MTYGTKFCLLDRPIILLKGPVKAEDKESVQCMQVVPG